MRIERTRERKDEKKQIRGEKEEKKRREKEEERDVCLTVLFFFQLSRRWV